MRFHQRWLLKTELVAVIAWMAGSAAFAQTKAQNSGGSTVEVDCNKTGSIGATLAHLSQIGSARGITILVSGTCKENIYSVRTDRRRLRRER